MLGQYTSNARPGDLHVGFASYLHPEATVKHERPDEKAKTSIPKPPTPWKHKKGTLGHVLRKSEMRNRESHEGSQRKHH